MTSDRTASVAAWAEDAARSSSAATTTTRAPEAAAPAPAPAPADHPQALPFRPTATITQHDAVRGTTVTLSIPLDEPAPVRPSEEPVAGDAARPNTPKKKLLRRDSLERREALLKGKEGSRRRQRWENGRLLNNPWAEPPLPSDWEVQPTHPRTVVPYFLAPLWEADANKRARRQSKAAKAKAKSTVESRASVLPRELREKLKKAKSARGLLMDLEMQVRRFIEDWNRRQVALERAGLDSVLEEEEEEEEDKEKDGNKDERKRRRRRKQDQSDDNDVAIEDDSEDELVFVGRQGQMKDVPPSPKVKREGQRSKDNNSGDNDDDDERKRPSTSGTGISGFSSDDDDDMVEIEAGGELLIMPSEKIVFGGPVEDHGASFARWIVHSIGDYYGLRTWSVTAGNPARREAYVAIDTMKTGRRSGVGAAAMMKSLPQPLWGMV